MWEQRLKKKPVLVHKSQLEGTSSKNKDDVVNTKRKVSLDKDDGHTSKKQKLGGFEENKLTPKKVKILVIKLIVTF